MGRWGFRGYSRRCGRLGGKVGGRSSRRGGKSGMLVLAGSEVAILADGSLDYEDDLLAKLDWVVASPHAALTQETQPATDRLVRAIANPHVCVVGHPTGRLVPARRGLEP